MAFETLATVQFASLVTAVTVLHDGETCVAGVRGSNYLRLYSLSELKASCVSACGGTGLCACSYASQMRLSADAGDPTREHERPRLG